MARPEVIQVTSDIWCVRRRSYLTCSYFVTTPTGTVLIDAGMDSGGRDMRFALEHAGVDLRSVRGMLMTHWHNDHAAGGRALQEALGAPVYYNRAEAPFFTREAARGGVRGWLSDVIPEWGLFVLFKGLLGEATPEAVNADGWVEDGAVLFDDFVAVATPGHTPGHVSYYHRPEKALFAGDALAVVGGRLHFMARPVTPDQPEARRSMLRCLEMDIEIVCPGHRGPLKDGVAEQRRDLAAYIEAGGKWPLLG